MIILAMDMNYRTMWPRANRRWMRFIVAALTVAPENLVQMYLITS
jgi:hypothetical protein